MWVRRDSAEFDKIDHRMQRRKFSPVGPLLLTLALMLIEFVVRRGTLSPFSFTPGAFLLLFVVVFSLLYLSRVVLGYYQLFPSGFPLSIKPTMICERCHTVQNDTESHMCNCGGQLEPIEHWRWQNDTSSRE
jgi:hypothetical protein